MSKLSMRSWPLVRQLTGGLSGEGREAMSARTERLQPRYAGASVARSARTAPSAAVSWCITVATQ
jgi:hypothetical protein